MKQLVLDIAAPPPPTLANFVAGRNAELVEHLRLVAAGKPAERFVYLWGAAGCGRSHLLRAAVAAAREAGMAAVYVGCAGEGRLPEAAARGDCVALDDVEGLEPAAQVAAFHLYNALRERGAALIAAGNAPPVQLGLRADLVTRLAWGLVYQVAALSDEEKAAALDQQARARGFRLPPGVREFMLTRAPRDIGSLLCLVDALDRRSLETKRAVTVPMARELLAEAGLSGDCRQQRRTGGAD